MLLWICARKSAVGVLVALGDDGEENQRYLNFVNHLNWRVLDLYG